MGLRMERWINVNERNRRTSSRFRLDNWIVWGRHLLVLFTLSLGNWPGKRHRHRLLAVLDRERCPAFPLGGAMLRDRTS